MRAHRPRRSARRDSTAGAAAQDRPVLTVYTYDSFASEWGPGAAIEPLFEEQCGCDLRLRSRGRRRGAAVAAAARGRADQGRRRGRARHQPDGRGGRRPTSSRHTGWTPTSTCRSSGRTICSCRSTGVGSRSSTAPGSMPRRASRRWRDSDVSIVIEDPRSSTPGPRPRAVGRGGLRRARRRDLGGAGRQRRDRDARAGPRPTVCSSRARRTWCCPTRPRRPTT